MVNLYATLIINKRRTFDQVPEKFKADVEAKLLEYGYDTNGDLIAERSNHVLYFIQNFDRR